MGEREQTSSRIHQRRRLCGWRLGVIALFVAGIFAQFAHLQAERGALVHGLANDGKEATFFGVHNEPYLLFSEDFYLFHLRAKRILDRGFAGSLLYSDPKLPHNFAAPFQAALGMIAAETGGTPFWYSLYMACVLMAAWSLLYVVAARYFPEEVDRNSILAAVLIAVVFQAPSLFGPKLDSSLWFSGRMLRMSSFSWSNPLLLASLILFSFLAFERVVKRRELIVSACFLIFLAGSDNRSYLPAVMACGLVLLAKAAHLAILSARGTKIRREELRGWWILTGIMLGSFAFQQLVFSSMKGDALVRAGVGAPWLSSPGKFKFDDFYFNQWKVSAIHSCELLALLIGAQLIKPIGRFLGALFALNMITGIGALVVVSIMGIRAFQTGAFFLRTDFILLFLLAISVLESARRAAAWSLARIRKRGARWFPAVWTALVLLGLARLCFILNDGIATYISVTGKKALALTADEESLRTWMKALPDDGRGVTVATMSHELNYLIAYWTDADLLLPEGFPFHNLESDQTITERLVGLLRFYRVTPEAWDRFDVRQSPADQKSWYGSRGLAGSQGFSYYIYHMAIYMDDDWHGGWPYHNRVLSLLRSGDPGIPVHPDLVVIDDVSRLAGAPDLSAYSLAFECGTLQTWKRR